MPSDVPLVAVGCGTHASLASVAVDNESGGERATSYLLQLGHRTVHHLAGPRDWLDAQEREAGWRRALEARGATVPDQVAAGDWSARSGFEVGRRMASDPDISAVFCGNDHMALGLLRAFQQAGRRIPEDVSVVGFDDIPECEYFGPSLTTIRQDFGELGRRALRVLVELIGDDPVAGPRLSASSSVSAPLVPSLVVRASSAPPQQQQQQR